MTRLITLGLAFVTLLAFGRPADAAQRMGISAGVYTVAARSAHGVEAFCYDLTRESPALHSYYTNVLTNAANAVVTIGSTHMSLQAAVDAGKVTIRGTQLTFERLMESASDPAYLSRVPKDRREYLQRAAHQWHQMTPSDRAAVERAAESDFAAQGDHSKLVFVNNTDQPLSVAFGQPAIFGDKSDQAPASVTVPKITDHGTVQDAIWKQETARHERLLAVAGVYGGATDGSLSEPVMDSLTNAIGLFQDSQGLPVTGRIDTVTEGRLAQAAADQHLIATLNNETANNYLAVTIETLPHAKILYRAVAGNGRVLYTGNSAANLVSGLQDAASKNNVGHVYLLPENLTPERVDALNISVRNAGNLHPDGPRVTVVQESEQALPLALDATFGKDVRDIDYDASAPVAVNSHFEKRVNLVHNDGSRSTLRVVGKTKAIVSSFLENLKYTFIMLKAYWASRPSGEILASLKAADILNLAVLKTQHDLGLSAKDLRDQLSLQLNSVQVTDQNTLWLRLRSA